MISQSLHAEATSRLNYSTEEHSRFIYVQEYYLSNVNSLSIESNKTNKYFPITIRHLGFGV
jgi:hypothetical protein